jgi:hypothetical protein
MATVAILPVRTMNKADSERVHELCSLIEKEQDRQKFLALVTELNQILSAKDARLRTNESDQVLQHPGSGGDVGELAASFPVGYGDIPHFPYPFCMF